MASRHKPKSTAEGYCPYHTLANNARNYSDGDLPLAVAEAQATHIPPARPKQVPNKPPPITQPGPATTGVRRYLATGSTWARRFTLGGAGCREGSGAACGSSLTQHHPSLGPLHLLLPCCCWPPALHRNEQRGPGHHASAGQLAAAAAALPPSMPAPNP